MIKESCSLFCRGYLVTIQKLPPIREIDRDHVSACSRAQAPQLPPHSASVSLANNSVPGFGSAKQRALIPSRSCAGKSLRPQPSQKTDADMQMGLGN